MKKKILLTSFLSLSLLLTACGKKDKEKSTINDQPKIETSQDEENIYFDEDKAAKKEVVVDKVRLDELMLNSDYITRIKVQVDAENRTTVNFLEDYKGDLSNVEIKLPSSLTASREYLIFYKDGPDGKIIPAKADDSFLEIQDNEDGNLKYIESHYIKDFEDDKKDDKKDNKKDTQSKKSSTTKSSSDLEKNSTTTNKKNNTTKESTTKNNTSKDTKNTTSTKTKK